MLELKSLVYCCTFGKALVMADNNLYWKKT